LSDGKNKIIDLNIVSTGTISSAPAWPREIVKPAILANAAAIILFHNHPNGDVAPSREDEAVTLKVIKACAALEIRVHKHWSDPLRLLSLDCQDKSASTRQDMR
jgi:DNA repair protein RadC